MKRFSIEHDRALYPADASAGKNPDLFLLSMPWDRR
jgi:hypothetical protein